MAASQTTGVVTPVVGDNLGSIAEVIGGEQYEFAPFEEQPEKGCGWAIKTTIAQNGSVVRKGRLTLTTGRTLPVRLWDRGNPIPANSSVEMLEFGTAKQGGEVVSDIVDTAHGMIRVPRVYARLKPATPAKAE